MKTRQDNNITDRIGMVYVETETEMLGNIWPKMISDENQIGQRYDNCTGVVYTWNETKLSQPTD